jgi:hypothetical protein
VLTPDEWARKCAEAAAAFAPPDVTGSPEEIERRCDDESDAARARRDVDERDQPEAEHCRRWNAYLMAWHAAADAIK